MRTLRRIARVVLALGGLAILALLWVWNDRPDLGATGLAVAEPAAGDGVRVTWLGVTTLLFDDGETRLLTDGFFSRPGLLDLLLDRRIEPDRAGIDAALAAAGITRLAAVMTVHSHYDHAMDAGEVAKRTGALVLGSASTANAARGAGLAEERIVEMADGASRRFGRFTVTFLPSRHAPLGEDAGPPIPGTIDAPLVPPAPVTAWREGGSYTLVIAHPEGSARVQGRAGCVDGALAGVRADVVLLGIGALSRLGRPHAERYWDEIVGRSGATRVFPVHWDDFTRPYGDVQPFPRLFDDATRSLGWLDGRGASGATPVRIELLPFREPVALFR